ncbi:hypothetical protein GCM10023350_47970 [Nocardioides endophyticus]|uniref:Transposase IS204/IS1001/IS1096/IS1165 zinc-finger domain-containing protein n=1 Tax=Nocardioides endophyticus TaxID=1353775 RepID=A0ABP8ZHH8_9ACTN
MLEVRIRRYRCAECGHVWRQDTDRAAEPRAKLSRRGLRWALEGIVMQHLTVARVAEGLVDAIKIKYDVPPGIQRPLPPTVRVQVHD